MGRGMAYSANIWLYTIDIEPLLANATAVSILAKNITRADAFPQSIKIHHLQIAFSMPLRVNPTKAAQNA